MTPDPTGMGGFFPGMFGDLLKLLRTDAPFPFELSLQLAQSVAGEGDPPSNVDPLERIRLERLLQIAELQVADVTGMTTTASGRQLKLVAMNRVDWARTTLESSRRLLEQVAAGLVPNLSNPDTTGLDDDEAEAAGLLAKWTGAVAPAIVAMQFGSIIGHLAQRSLGQYELPLPRDSGDELALITPNLASFAEDWSLPPDDVALYLLVRDTVAHAVVSRPHVKARLEALLVAHAEGFRSDPAALEQHLGERATGAGADLASVMRMLGDPAALGELVDTPELRRVRAELAALAAALSGYVEWVTDTVGLRAVGSTVAIREAIRRRRVERTSDERDADALFGMLLDQYAVDRGEAFVRGVLERGGSSELTKLWVVEENLPTPAEVDAPGLWIARVNLPRASEAPETASRTDATGDADEREERDRDSGDADGAAPGA